MKKIIGIAISVLMATLFCVTAFAVEPRWKNVIAISPTISAESQSYSSYIVADPKATKMECTLVLYEKGFWGNYTEVDRTSSTYYGFRHEFNGSYPLLFLLPRNSRSRKLLTRRQRWQSQLCGSCMKNTSPSCWKLFSKTSDTVTPAVIVIMKTL